MLLGFAITRHCNLRCPHCIRDDVESVHELEPELIARIVDEARALWVDEGDDGDGARGGLVVSMTGGEPMIHRRFDEIVASLGERGVPYRFVSNGWHTRRIVPLLRRWPPQHVRLSLSGGSEDVHDAERGRGSFHRVLLSVGILTSLGVPCSLSVVIDRRDRHQIRELADLAERLGCIALHYILPQPVTGSIERGTDLEPAEWWDVAREVRGIAAENGRRTRIRLDYGAPMEPGRETRCDTFALRRVYVDVEGRLSTCCQLSEYGFNEHDVVADLHDVSLAEAWPRYIERLRAQERASDAAATGDPSDALPCIRCARATGKMEWAREYPDSSWSRAAGPADDAPPARLVQIGR